MVGEVVSPRRERGVVGRNRASKAQRLTEIEGDPEERIPLPIGEFSRVLGGGVVPGSVVLIGGDPGIGKSTLLLQAALAMSKKRRVLYISGEESERQIKARSARVLKSSALPHELFLLTETHLESVVDQIQSINPDLVVVDSIQTIQSPDLDSAAGSISQVRECAHQLQSVAKSTGVAIFLVGHVTKDGAIAGPKVLEHIVDTVLYLEGDAFHAYRLLRSVKNRFGPTSEVGVFEMRPTGMEEVSNPSEAFLAERVLNSPGSTIAVTMEGTRPLLVEIQGLTSTTTFGNPRRTANGVDFNRLLLTVAVLTRRVGLRLSDQDVFVNVVGGLRIAEPAADLAVAASIASSMKDRPIDKNLALIGEVGLSGELRSVAQLSARMNEASKLGFKGVIVPKSSNIGEDWPSNIEIIQVATLREALQKSILKE
jgi:DNA repair protein RadA/Sms